AVAAHLQALAGHPQGPGWTRALAEPGIYLVAIPYEEETVGRACLDAARALCLAALDDRPFEVAAEVRRLRELADAQRLGRSTLAILQAARARDIPVYALNPSDWRLLQLGQGVRRQLMLAAETEATGAIAASISQDKELTKELLRAVGVPVPEGRPVADADDAWAAAQELGLPVVVKPQDRDLALGVYLDLRTEDQVRAAYAAARAASEAVVVERFAPGVEHRVLVVGDRVVAAARIQPPQVVGDGRSTIAELVEAINRDPRRGETYLAPKYKITLDDNARAALAAQGYSFDSVPPAGARVLIHRNPPHIENGGDIIDVTDRVHPEVAARALEATRIVGLDVAGLDLVAEDIGRPLEEQGGVIVEINAGPGLWLHMAPWCEPARPVGEAIVASMIPEGQDGRIPIVAVTGTNGKTTTTRLIAHILAQAGPVVGMTCSDGIYVGGRRVAAGDCTGPLSARAVMLNPQVEAAVLETARGGILKHGLGYDRCDVAVVTCIGGGDHLGSRGVETLEDLARVKRVVVEVVVPNGTAVLKADDPLVAAMAPHCPGKVLYFAQAGAHPVLAAHRAAGGRAVFVRDGVIVLAEGGREEPVLPLEQVPLTHGGRVSFQVENALAATAAAWARGVALDAIRAGLRSFSGDATQAPGRFNVLEADGATVIVDFAHNASALAALAAALDRFPKRRRSIVYSAAGSRTDADIIAQGRALGEAFDHVLLYEGDCNYNRPDGEVIALLRRGLAEGRRVSEIRETRGERAAIATALETLRPGDLLVIGPESIEESLAFVRRRLAAMQDRR
ncbi:MAG: cyanophycin synthetase, partial [Isosphaeraceae bacterium]|nr:cyanophycin synthetase [Isosphaeraceae bacterium]